MEYLTKVGRTLETFLTPNSINVLLMCYRKDYKTYLIDRYWNNKDSKTMIRDAYSQPIYKEMVTIVYNDLCEHRGQPLTVAIMNKELVEVEYEQLESIDALKNKYDKFISVMEKKNQK